MGDEPRLFALCPVIERKGADREPLFFDSEVARTEYLNRETTVEGVPFPPEMVRRNEELRRQERERALLEPVIDLDTSPEYGPTPNFLIDSDGNARSPDKTIRNASQGWVPVPVCRLRDHSDRPRCSRTVRDFLTIDVIGPMPTSGETADQELLRLAEDVWEQVQGVSEASSSADFTCCLENDWQFDQIEADPRRRVGHDYAGDKHDSIAAIVVKAVYDIEDALLRFHRNASCAAVADFWRSWQVREHIAVFCARLASSETAQTLVAKGDAEDQVERARWYVYRRLTVFAHEVVDRDHAAEPSAARDSVNRGGRPKGTPVNRANLRRFCKLAGLTQVALAKECEVSLSTIGRASWSEEVFLLVAGELSRRTGKTNPVSPADLKNLENLKN